MKILFIGDVVGSAGSDFLRKHLRALRGLYGAQLAVVNGENSSDSNGCTPQTLDALLDGGADIITLGNHTYHHREVYDYLDTSDRVIRPANFHPSLPGRGECFFDTPGLPRVRVCSLMGNVHMDYASSCFAAADVLFPGAPECVTLLDFHAEATSEKMCMALYLDGKVSAVAGTHTHIQTADERILPGGTGCITDAGMCGPFNSSLGCDEREPTRRFRFGVSDRFVMSRAPVRLSGVLFEIDDRTKKTVRVERVNVDE